MNDSLKTGGKPVIGLLGGPGSGKSTVIWAVTRLLAGNAVVEGGEVLFNGEDVLGYGEDDLRRYRFEIASLVRSPRRGSSGPSPAH